MRAYHFLISVTVAWSCGFYSVGLGQEGALPVTTDLHAHGLNEQQLDSLADILQHAVDQQAIAGCSFLIVHRGEVVFREAFGFADIELERAFTTNELVPIASVSKPVLASVVMALVDQGKLTLDDPVEKYLPEFKDMKVKGGKHLARRMTIRHLLSHTAGFWGNKGISAEKLDLIRNFQRPLGEAVSRMATYELEYQPGTKFVYSGSGFCVAGRVAEVVLNQSLEQIAQEVLFRPLGLRHTTYLPSKEIRKTVPTAYSRQSGGVLERQPSRTGGELRFILPGGSLFTTLDELATFGVMHLENGTCHDKQVLSRESTDEMRTLQLPQKVTRRYGLGWNCDDMNDQGLADRLYHGGAMGTYLVVDRKRELVGAFLIHQPGHEVAGLRNNLLQHVGKLFAPSK
ncbi:MAG: serine hydrolase domain-containing protein [Pirellulales bacterium]|jgi:CubicO group peptidase (beta-lactamase class C family)